MNIMNFIKVLYEKVPKGIKYAFSPIFIRLMVYNPEFKKTWNELDSFEKLTVEEKKKKQLEKLKNAMIYAYNNVPYYKEIFNRASFNPKTMQKVDEIKALPILEKADAVHIGEKLYSEEKNLKYYKTFTGGSSGQALTVLLDRDSIYRERACVVHYLSQLGYDPLKTRTVAFWGHNKDENYYYSPLKNEIVISPFRLFKKDQLTSICNDINKFGATFVMGYPSAIYLFAQMLENTNKKMHFDHVVYYAENCNDEERQYIEKVLDCSVDSYYGHTERACFAEIRNTGCFFNDYYGYTELIPTDTEDEYRIVCTGFLSRKMPLIRYATDDVVKIQSDGNMHLIGHKRSETYLIGKDGQKIFKGSMTLHIEELKKIKQYQYVQYEPGKAELLIVKETEISSEEFRNINKYIKRRCEGLLDVEIRYVDEIKLTTRGKYIWAINKIDEQKD